jgi:hypothetical protein
MLARFCCTAKQKAAFHMLIIIFLKAQALFLSFSPKHLEK